MTKGDQRSGEAEKSAVQIAVAFVADAQAAESMQPADCALDDLTTAAQSGAIGRATLGQEELDAFGPQPLAERFAVVSAIRVEPEDFLSQRVRKASQQSEQILGIVHVGCRQAGGQRHSASIGPDVVLAARFGPVDGIGPRLAPPKPLARCWRRRWRATSRFSLLHPAA